MLLSEVPAFLLSSATPCSASPRAPFLPPSPPRADAGRGLDGGSRAIAPRGICPTEGSAVQWASSGTARWSSRCSTAVRTIDVRPRARPPRHNTMELPQVQGGCPRWPRVLPSPVIPSGPRLWGTGDPSEAEKQVGRADVVCRDKYKTWTDDSTEFMLQWYVDYQKDKPAPFRWKQHHHHLCAEALNARFGIGATRHQVYRHFRAFKEKWNWIKQAMAKSGNGFDAASKRFNLPYSERSPSKLGVSFPLHNLCITCT
ncbi:hypothetical protein PVAP13_9NG717877 [Panicum virgatum]|uniref:Uncharacterized protein n=1 Tax=Panicum virgatum TaxID=38727 RepID=A0A8T0N2E9_PANVG|nr:hypothetical protein PVAP13_9NG717877 [Panicum virgatum]